MALPPLVCRQVGCLMRGGGFSFSALEAFVEQPLGWTPPIAVVGRWVQGRVAEFASSLEGGQTHRRWLREGEIFVGDLKLDI